MQSDRDAKLNVCFIKLLVEESELCYNSSVWGIYMWGIL